jgi:hypothetical protein
VILWLSGSFLNLVLLFVLQTDLLFSFSWLSQLVGIEKGPCEIDKSRKALWLLLTSKITKIIRK